MHERVHQDHVVHSMLLQYVHNVVALKAMAFMISVYSIVARVGLS